MNSEISMGYMSSYNSNLIAAVVILLIKSPRPCRGKTVNVSMQGTSSRRNLSDLRVLFFTEYDPISPVFLQFFHIRNYLACFK